MWRGVQARIDVGRGDSGTITLAREAVSLSEASDSRTLQADALLALAEVGDALGDRDLAADAAARAVSLYESKGSSAGIERVKRLISESR